MAIGTALALASGALIGGIAGSQKDKSQTTSTSSVDPGKETDLEFAGKGGLANNYGILQDYTSSGPNGGDVSNATGASRTLADMFGEYSRTGGLPTNEDITSANSIAGNLFNPQRVAMRQAFDDQQVAADRAAALLGRSTNDPILRAKLAQEQTRQNALLEASQGSFAQQFALGQPDRRLGYASQRAGILSGLATQAMQNRTALAAMGEGIMNNERNFRLATATKYGNSTEESGGGLKGAISGAIGGAGMGLNIGSMFSGNNFAPRPTTGPVSQSPFWNQSSYQMSPFASSRTPSLFSGR